MKTLSLQISGMTCGHCVKAVEQALQSLPGVSSFEVRIGHADVRIEDHVTVDQIVSALAAEDYAATEASAA